MAKKKDSQTAISFKELGAKNYAKGYSFEDEVNELYRLQHYEVEHNRLFGGRQIDFFLTRRLADLTIYRAIEAKSGPVGADEIDAFTAKLQLVRIEYPSAIGTIVSGSTFTAAVAAHAAAVGIQLTLFRDLAAQLFDGNGYVRNLRSEFSNSTGYLKELYVEPFVLDEGNENEALAFETIDEWLADSRLRQLTLLGDVGTGKSFLSKMIAERLSDRFLLHPYNNPVPILIDLRNADRELSLEGLILTHFAKGGFTDVSFDTFQYALSRGRIVLILDGFDEMAARVTPQITARNFNELVRTIQGNAKVILTCRTHYFKNRAEEEALVHGTDSKYENDSARELYWDLISRKGFKIAYLQPFSESQIVAYVTKARPNDTRKVLKKIRDTYNLMELSQRPMLLSMIVQSIDKIGNSDINQATLYRVFTDVWIHRDKWRDVISPGNKLTFLTDLAQKLWEEGTPTIHYSHLSDFVQDCLSTEISSEQERLEIDNEIRTATFLTRDRNGNYGFAHKSFHEYFFARYLASQFELGNFECLHTRRITPEVVSFLYFLCDFENATSTFESILCDRFRPHVTENSLVLLYGLKKERALAETGDGGVSPITLPKGMKLAGSVLENVDLRGAEMEGCDLAGANLQSALLNNTNLREAALPGAVLSKANLTNSDLSNSDLSDCRLNDAVLTGANISFALVASCQFNGSFLDDITFEAVNFERAILNDAFLSNELSEYIKNQRGNAAPEVDLQGLVKANSWFQLMSHRNKLLNYCERSIYLSDPSVDYEDIVSEALSRMYMSREFHEKTTDMKSPAVYNYLKRFLREIAQKVNAGNRGRVEIDFPQLADLESEVSSDPVDSFDKFSEFMLEHSDSLDAEKRLELEEILEAIEEELSPDQREIFEAYFVDECNKVEISQKLNISQLDVHVRIRQLTQQLRSMLERKGFGV